MGRVFGTIRKIVAKIPKGKVLTYGDVARIAGINNPRVVGWALRGNQDPKIPCHRVIKKAGFLAEGYSLIGWQEQKRRLEKEAVGFIAENQVDMKEHHWLKKQRRTDLRHLGKWVNF